MGRWYDDFSGEEEVSRISQQIGLPEDETAEVLAQALPQVVDQATPEGQVPSEGKVDEWLSGASI
jgi:uncharacterized protein YidB (DUF937 family)